jgi:hypothetical protein
MQDNATRTHNFRFALRDEVKVILSGAGFIGHVIGQATSLYAQDSFLVQYKWTQGTPAMEWFHEGQLERTAAAVDIDAACHAEARAEETAVAQANVAESEPKSRLFGIGTMKIEGGDFQKHATSYAFCNLGHNGASVSLYIPDIEQKPGEPIADFLLRAAAALQGRATTL